MSASALLAEAWSEPRQTVWSNFKVAIVDDNFINQKILCRQLEKYLGITIQSSDIFDNGKLLLDRLARVRYDLVLLDIEMPVLDGMETAVRIRSGLPSPEVDCGDVKTDPMLETPTPALTTTLLTPTSPGDVYPPSPTPSDTSHLAVLPENREIPIVAVTCNAQLHQRQLYLSLGINAVVEKPLDPELLIPIVKHYLRTCQYASLPRFQVRGGGGVSPRRTRPSHGKTESDDLARISAEDDEEEDNAPRKGADEDDADDDDDDDDADDGDDHSTVCSDSTDSSSSTRLRRIFDSVLHTSGLSQNSSRRRRLRISPSHSSHYTHSASRSPTPPP